MQMAHMNMMKCTHPTVTAVEFDDRTAFTCDLCFEIGYDSGYQCSNGCDYQLHEECLYAPEVSHHPFFSSSFTLQRQESPNTKNLCTACGMTVKGLRYCQIHQRGSIFMHPCCMKLPHSTQASNGVVLYLKRKLVTVKCNYCECITLGGGIDGWAYVSADEKLALHVKCIEEMQYKEWKARALVEREEVERPSHYDRPEIEIEFELTVGGEEQNQIATHERYYIAEPEQYCGAGEEQFQSTAQEPYYNADQEQYCGTGEEQYQSTSQEPYYNADQEQYCGAGEEQYFNADQKQYCGAGEEQYQSASQDLYYNADQEQYCGVGEEQYQSTGQEQYYITGEEEYCITGQEEYCYTIQEEYCSTVQDASLDPQTFFEAIEPAVSILSSLGDSVSLIGAFSDLFVSTSDE